MGPLRFGNVHLLRLNVRKSLNRREDVIDSFRVLYRSILKAKTVRVFGLSHEDKGVKEGLVDRQNILGQASTLSAIIGLVAPAFTKEPDLVPEGLI